MLISSGKIRVSTKSKKAFLLINTRKFPGHKIKIQAMKGYGAFPDRLFHQRVKFQMFHLKPDIFHFNHPDSFLNLLCGFRFFNFGINTVFCFLCIMQPDRYVIITAFLVIHCFYSPAVRMPADNDMFHFEIHQGEFKNRSKIPVL